MDKPEVYKKCVELLKQKVDALTNDLHELSDSIQNETKSTSGDKHEVGRAMAQIEYANVAKQLDEANKQLGFLMQLTPAYSGSKVKIGSLVISNTQSYYIAVSLGKVEVEGSSIFVVSGASPIGQLLVGKNQGDSISFNGKELKILEVK